MSTHNCTETTVVICKLTRCIADMAIAFAGFLEQSLLLTRSLKLFIILFSVVLLMASLHLKMINRLLISEQESCQPSSNTKIYRLGLCHCFSSIAVFKRPAQWVSLRNIQACFIREMWFFGCSCAFTLGPPLELIKIHVMVAKLMSHCSSMDYPSQSESRIYYYLVVQFLLLQLDITRTHEKTVTATHMSLPLGF